MRTKVAANKKHKARGVSLPPAMAKAAVSKIGKLEMGFSEYVQRLIQHDLSKNTMAEIMAEDAQEARKAA